MRPRRLAARLLSGAALGGAGLALFLATAHARPGGGDAFDSGWSSSSSSSGSHGSGGDGDVDIGLIIELVVLCIRHPPLGIAAVVIVGGYYTLKSRGRRGLRDWSTSLPAPVEIGTDTTRAAPARRLSTRAELAGIQREDPGFSLILFDDFAYALYAEIQVSRARGGIGRLAPFLSPAVARLLYDPALERVDGVVIGALRYAAVERGPERIGVTLEFEANFSEIRQGAGQRFYAVDRLRLTRSRSARSRPPSRVRKLDCPNCGAPLEGMRGTTCAYCRTEVGGGRLDWMVESLERVKTELRAPLITTDVPERGTELPTVVAPGCHERLAAFSQRDPAHDPSALWARIGLIFAELQVGWSNRDLLRIRPFVTDNLFQYFAYWIDVYYASRARNVTENARVLNIELAEVTSDATYDAVTVRVFATGLDYVVSDDGRLLRGSQQRERPYTEYWTLVRGHGVRGRARTDRSCPRCGAPLKIGMAGNCEYCHARVVAGEFDWVLSRIEQDEAYGR